MRLRQFAAYVRKVFHLHRLAGRTAEAWAALERLKAIHARYPQLAEGL